VRVIGVIDIKSGVAVHARGGHRELYEPVRSPLLPLDRPGDAAILARGYRDKLGLAEIYVADLDAIGGRAMQDLTGILGSELPLMVDAGVTTEIDAQHALGCGATRVVVGLETLESFDDFTHIVRSIGTNRVVFSLDLRGAHPIVQSNAPFAGLAPIALARGAVRCGASAVLVLDLARVGRSVGVDIGFVRAIRAELPDVELLVGGGVRDRADLDQLAGAGCDGALVGTALHEGVGLLDLPHA